MAYAVLELHEVLILRLIHRCAVNYTIFKLSNGVQLVGSKMVRNVKQSLSLVNSEIMAV